MQRILLAIIAVVLAGGIAFYLTRAREEAPTAPVADARPAPPARTAEPPAPKPAPEPAADESAARKAARRKAAPAPAAEAPASPTLASLTLDSDVPGASVFINREFVGTTPLTLAKLDPGAKEFKLTAPGFDGIDRTVELAAGDNSITLKFKEVRLNKRIAVTHKHGMGSCEGTLVATVDGLAYETANKNHAFKLPYAQVESFTVDYLEKNLKVKQKGGKNWNFTEKNAANADALFVFHRDVEAARQKLADGYAAVR